VAASAAPVPRLRPAAPPVSAEREGFDADRITAMLDEPPPSPETPPQGASFDIDAVTAMLDAPRTQPAGDTAAPALEVDRLTAMLDGDPPDQSPVAVGESAAVGSLIAAAAGPMTANEIDALRARLAGCWSPPLGWHDPAEVRVVVMLNLNPDGSLGAAPEVLESPAGRYQVAAPDSVVRAVRRCAPYNLPPEKYDSWQQMRITFDPVDMGAT
jgi:colicin import membrane protein